MPHEKFHYKTLEDVKAKAAELGVHLPFAGNTSVLSSPLTFDNITLRNRMGIAPMEGADSTPEGSPSEYTFRRYVREAVGGAALIWFEAVSMVQEGRSSATQLFISEENLDEYKRLTEAVKEAGQKANGFAASMPFLKSLVLFSYKPPYIPGRVYADESSARRYPWQDLMSIASNPASLASFAVVPNFSSSDLR